jgi:hypothetical protein
MAAAPEKLAALRHLLAERFPAANRIAGRTLPTGIAAIDEIAGGLPLGAVTELVCAAPSAGGQLFLGQLLATTRAARVRVALVDGLDAFDPCSYPADLLAHLLWVRGRSVPESLQAADLLARDANLGLVVLDLQNAPATELRRIASRQWYRLQRAVEPSDLVLVIQTSQPTVPSAQLRLVLDRPHASAVFEQERPALIANLAPTLQRQRLSLDTLETLSLSNGQAATA